MPLFRIYHKHEEKVKQTNKKTLKLEKEGRKTLLLGAAVFNLPDGEFWFWTILLGALWDYTFGVGFEGHESDNLFLREGAELS